MSVRTTEYRQKIVQSTATAITACGELLVLENIIAGVAPPQLRLSNVTPIAAVANSYYSMRFKRVRKISRLQDQCYNCCDAPRERKERKSPKLILDHTTYMGVCKLQ